MPGDARRRPVRSLVLAAGLAALLTLPAGAAVRLGTPSGEILTGTNKADNITGDAGNDTLRGLAGNDTYHFADGWGSDLLEEKATYRVAGKKVPGGRDTLSFRGVEEDGVQVILIPQWRGLLPNANRAVRPAGDEVELGGSIVEDVVGSRNRDVLAGGGATNRLDTGGGVTDVLQDVGGWKDGAVGLPGLPASSDVYRGAANTGLVDVLDIGGAADVLDLRPLRGDEVYLAAIDCDFDDAERECLQVVTGNGDGQIVVAGQFGEVRDNFDDFGHQGRIETLLFADGPVAFGGGAANAAKAAGGARDGEAILGRADNARQRELAKRAPALAREALKQSAALPPPGELPTGRERDR